MRVRKAVNLAIDREGIVQRSVGAASSDARTLRAALLAFGIWAIRRYLFLLMRAEATANQASCPDCGDYGRFSVVGQRARLLEMDVRQVETIRQTFEKYLFAEQVKMSSLVGRVHRMTLHGPEAGSVLHDAMGTVFPDLGHNPNWERPQDVAAAISTFLD